VSTFMLWHVICITLTPLRNTFEEISSWLLDFILTSQCSFAWKDFHLQGCSYPPTSPTPEESKATSSSSGNKMNKNIMRLSVFND
jgi:hypothetical protein